MVVDFIEDEHIYIINGDIASISTTALLRKHGLAPNYDFVDDNILKENAEFGTEIHKELENIVNIDGFKPVTGFGENFKKWKDDNVKSARAEVRYGLLWGGLIVGGTLDLMGILKDGSQFLEDHKITHSANKEYVAWQTSFADYCLRRLNYEPLNGVQLNWEGAKKRFVGLFDKKTQIPRFIELDIIPDIEIEALLNAELMGEIYQRPQLAIDHSLELAVVEAENYYFKKKKELEEAERNVKNFREQLLKLFKEQGIKSWENDRLKVTYVPASSTISVDSTKLKREAPLIYQEYSKVTSRKDYLIIKERGSDDE